MVTRSRIVRELVGGAGVVPRSPLHRDVDGGPQESRPPLDDQDDGRRRGGHPMSPRVAVPIDDTPTPPAPPRQSVFWYYSSENQSPLVTPEFLARQRRLLMPAQYAREHEN